MTKEQAIHWRGLARKYHALGINIVPLGDDKRPVVIGVNKYGGLQRFRWEDWQTTRQEGRLFDALLEPAWWMEVRGIAAVCGAISGNLVCLDFDHCTNEIVSQFLRELGLPNNYAWTVKTPGGGYHIWLRSASANFDIPKGKVRRPVPGLVDAWVELRWTGHYTALPGSHHPTGGIYSWAFSQPTEAPMVLEASNFVAVYYKLTIDPPKNEKPSPTTHSIISKPNKGDMAAYVAKAVNEECNALRVMAPNTGRNDRLNRAAFTLGTLVGAGALNQSDAENALYDAARQCGLDDGEIFPTIASGMNAGMKQPRNLFNIQCNHDHTAGENSEDTDVTAEDAQAFLDDGGEPVEWNPWPYAEHEGRMVYCTESEDGVKRSPIADFVAKNVEEIIDEDGSRTVIIEGRALRGGSFRLEVNGKAFGEDRVLRSLLEQAAGARDPVYSRMSGHLATAIKKLTGNELTVIRRFRRTGWYSGQFLIPGLHGGDVVIELPHKLPYSTNPQANVNKGLTALNNLLKCIDPTCTTPVIAMMLEAPLHRLLRNRKRYGIFIQGRTGSLKTSWTQTAMCIYGERWNDDAALLKWGEGATRNAIMTLAASAHDMPLMIDNYKPNTGDGDKGFNTLIHNIIEGGNRERLRRDGTLIASQAIHAYPLCTGEDVPQNDSASLARLFVVTFPWQGGESNNELTAAQIDSPHLSAIGYMWLTWLASAEGKTTVANCAEMFPKLREKWALYLHNVRIDAGNPLRIAENLASNELAWLIACQHPQIGAVLKPYTETHQIGLRIIAARMADSTADALEAVQFIHAIKELITSKQFLLIDKAIGEPADFDAGKVLGWYDSIGVYLLPAIALAAARRVLGHGSLMITPRTLNDQLARRGYLVPGSERNLKTIRVGARTVRVMHLRPEAFIDDDNKTMLEELGI